MSEQEQEQATQETAVSSAEMLTTEQGHNIPLARFNQVNEERKEALLELQALKDAQATANEAQLVEDQKWQQLAEDRQARITELEPYEAQLQAIVTATQERNASRIENIPDDKKSLIPDYADPQKLASWLDANEATLNAKTAVPSLNGGAGSGSARVRATVLSDDQLRQAKKMGLTADEYSSGLPN